MYPCPACKQVAFIEGRCSACGFQVVQGRAATGGAPPALDPSALSPAPAPSAGGGPSLPGFESTSLVPDPTPRTPDPASVDVAACPRCRAPQPRPNPVACDACGYRLKARSRDEDEDEDENDSEYVKCKDCGTTNPEDRSVCMQCGGRLSQGI